MTNIIKILETKFGKMSITRETKLDFPGIKLTFYNNSQLEIDIKQYV